MKTFTMKTITIKLLTMKTTNTLTVLLLALLAITPSVFGAESSPISKASATDFKWIEPFEAAKQEAKKTGKPMLVFIGNTDVCKDCQAFANSVRTSRRG